ncbi:MAG: hypothetical protein HYT10_02560 [Candidatus Levybacteria bacterium]|nr:hypothetical protein [Candidatus Levybacteria bacterium]
MDIENLRKFLLEAANKGYALGESAFKKGPDDSYIIEYESGNFRFHDNWFGGEPFGGREVVFYKEKAEWIMVYYGADSGKADGLIQVLRKALANPPKELPVRGPKTLVGGGFRYVNKWQGNLEKFKGEEVIYYKNEEVYTATYVGGFIDQRGDQL